jgi:hypothetical protein
MKHGGAQLRQRSLGPDLRALRRQLRPGPHSKNSLMFRMYDRADARLSAPRAALVVHQVCQRPSGLRLDEG